MSRSPCRDTNSVSCDRRLFSNPCSPLGNNITTHSLWSFALRAVHTTNLIILLAWVIIRWDRKRVLVIWWLVSLPGLFSRGLFFSCLQSISLRKTVENIIASKRMILMNWAEAGLVSLCSLAKGGCLGFVLRSLSYAGVYAPQLLAIIGVVYGWAAVFLFFWKWFDVLFRTACSTSFECREFNSGYH